MKPINESVMHTLITEGWLNEINDQAKKDRIQKEAFVKFIKQLEETGELGPDTYFRWTGDQVKIVDGNTYNWDGETYILAEGMITEGEKPLRNRVEVIALNDKGQVYGGVFPDGSFGLFGGGTDGEAGEEAAQREFEEETGHDITQVQKVDLEPVEAIWRHDPKKAKDKDRQEQYRGTRTWFFTGQFQDGDGKKASGDDGKSPLKDVGWYDINDAIKWIEDNLSDQQDQKAQQEHRIKALKTVKSQE